MGLVVSTDDPNIRAAVREVMKIEGFDETKLAFAFDHLIQNELRAGPFALKNARLRIQWLESFFNQNS
ncbi:hypothetical protein CFP56_025876 [Quercus suber]|uniref:Uncharacterized protein n=1 Tax=Quercus suber TaxID=58331 RepID=A0AAW0K197_QUESU